MGLARYHFALPSTSATYRPNIMFHMTNSSLRICMESILNTVSRVSYNKIYQGSLLGKRSETLKRLTLNKYRVIFQDR